MVSLRVEGVDPDEAAGALAIAFQLDRAVEIGPEGLIHIWLGEGEEGLAAGLAEEVRRIFPGAQAWVARSQTSADVDWPAQWRKTIKPIRLGERIIIAPTFDRPAPGHGGIEVIMDPGMAFGSGLHPSTALCAAALERHVSADVLDIGCGSGVLAIIAVKLGARRALGVDNDPEAIRVAGENVKLNGLEGRVGLVVCQTEALRGTFGAVAANLFLDAHLALAGEYLRLLAPGGRAILSGLKSDQAAAAEEGMAGQGFALAERMEKEGWTALIFRKPPGEALK
jgi:ribosomal protein L11 methyltransferase